MARLANPGDRPRLRADDAAAFSHAALACMVLGVVIASTIVTLICYAAGQASG